MEASVDPLSRGPDWMPITPKRGSFLHADPHPTAAEAGLPGFHISIWHALWAPKGTPKDIIARLNAAAMETLADSAVRARLIDMGQEIPARDRQTAEALGAFHKAEIEKWWPILRAANIKVE